VHVAGELLPPDIILHQIGSEAPLQQMPTAPMPPIEPDRNGVGSA
jgi:hypothetical protein